MFDRAVPIALGCRSVFRAHPRFRTDLEQADPRCEEGVEPTESAILARLARPSRLSSPARATQEWRSTRAHRSAERVWVKGSTLKNLLTLALACFSTLPEAASERGHAACPVGKQAPVPQPRMALRMRGGRRSERAARPRRLRTAAAIDGRRGSPSATSSRRSRA